MSAPGAGVGHTGGVTTATDQQPPAPAQPAPARKKERGRESAADMVRSLGLVMLLVVPLWFLAQPGRDAEEPVREVDQSRELRAWSSSVPGAPAPARELPGWRPTVSDLPSGGLRLGWNTASGQYAELAATTGAADPFVAELVGEATEDGALDVGGSPWTRYTEPDGSISLVRRFDGVTVVVGTFRGTAPLEELVALAGTVGPSRS